MNIGFRFSCSRRQELTLSNSAKANTHTHTHTNTKPQCSQTTCVLRAKEYLDLWFTSLRLRTHKYMQQDARLRMMSVVTSPSQRNTHTHIHICAQEHTDRTTSSTKTHSPRRTSQQANGQTDADDIPWEGMQGHAPPQTSVHAYVGMDVSAQLSNSCQLAASCLSVDLLKFP